MECCLVETQSVSAKQTWKYIPTIKKNEYFYGGDERNANHTDAQKNVEREEWRSYVLQFKRILFSTFHAIYWLIRFAWLLIFTPNKNASFLLFDTRKSDSNKT